MRQKKTMRQNKGGSTLVFVDNKNAEQNFAEFLENSDITYLSKGSNGIVFKATLNPSKGYVSKYKNIDYSGFNNAVESLVIKISVLGYKATADPDKMYLNPITEEDFSNEVNIQTDIFLKTMQYLHPLCPAIVYSNTFSDTSSPVIQTIRANIKSNKHKEVVSDIIDNAVKYSVIGMEMLTEYKTM